MAKGRKAGIVKKKIKMLIYGEKYTGKSTLALQSMYLKNEDGSPFKVLYIDTENGSVDYYLDKLVADGIDLNNLYILYTQSLEETNDYINKVIAHEPLYELDENGNHTENIILDAEGKQFDPDCIVVDSASIFDLTVKQGLTKLSQKRASVRCKKDNIFGDERMVKVQSAGLEIKDYNLIKAKGQDFILTLNGCDKHVIITARETDEKVSMNVNGQITSVATGRKIPEGFKGMDYNITTYLRLYRTEDNEVCAFFEKDRSDVHGDCETVIDPTLLDYQVLIDKSKGLTNFNPGNSFSQAIQTAEQYAAKELEEDSVMDSVNTTVVETTKMPETAVELKAAIKKQLQSVTNPVEKQNLKTYLSSKNLSVAYTKCEDVNELKMILDEICEFLK